MATAQEIEKKIAQMEKERDNHRAMRSKHDKEARDIDKEIGKLKDDLLAALKAK